MDDEISISISNKVSALPTSTHLDLVPLLGKGDKTIHAPHQPRQRHPHHLFGTSAVKGGKYSLPLVTGMFDKDDVLASTAGMIAGLLFKVEWGYKPLKVGERTMADRIMLVLLREHSDQYYLDTYEQYLLLRDRWLSVPGHDIVGKALHYSFWMVGNVYNFVYSTLLKLVGESVDDQQVVRIGNPNVSGSTNPTHSQVAKDHDTHPFHVIAAMLACCKQCWSSHGCDMDREISGRPRERGGFLFSPSFRV